MGEYLGRVERFDPGNIGSDEQQGTAAEGDIVYGGLPDFDVGAGDSDGEVGDFGDAETAPLRGLREGGLPRIR